MRLDLEVNYGAVVSLCGRTSMAYGARVTSASFETLWWWRDADWLADLSGREMAKTRAKADTTNNEIVGEAYRTSLRLNPVPPRSRLRR